MYQNQPEDDVYWHPDIDNYPYIGENVWGGGGRYQEADIFVPPQKNLYYGAGLGGIISLGTIITLAIGIALGVAIAKRKKLI